MDSEYRFAVIVTALNVIEWSIVIAIPIVQVMMQFLYYMLQQNHYNYLYNKL